MRFLTALALIFAACGGGAEPADDSAEPTGGGEAAAMEATFADDIRTICDAPNEMPPAIANASPDQRAVLLAEHVEAQLQTPEGHELFRALADVGPAERATMLRQAEGAPEPCVLAGEFDEAAALAADADAEGGTQSDEPSVEPGGANGGDREPAAIAGVIRQHTNQVRYCYERQLVQQPDLEGDLKMRFTIAADGSVAAVEVTEAMHPAVDECVKERIRSWTFSESDGVTVVNYPFVFAHTQD